MPLCFESPIAGCRTLRVIGMGLAWRCVFAFSLAVRDSPQEARSTFAHNHAFGERFRGDFVTICVSVALSTAAEAVQTKTSIECSPCIPGNAVNYNGAHGRSLRAEKTRAVSEERENLWTRFYNALRVRWWLETEKTDEQVMKILKLTGRSGDELTGHPNFKTFAKFAKTAEKYKLGEWYRSRVSTYDAWVKLGQEDVPLHLVHQTPAYWTNYHYVNMFDYYASIAMKNRHQPPVLVSEKASPKEMSRVLIWAATERSDDYVKAVLGILGKSGEALTTHAGYKYYKQYLGHLEEAKKVKTATTAA
uniref:Avh282 n=1 Tax=Phytophthora sojae TaxID=67593 RepID=G1FSL0_PHYSO|nr:Avh282 [Phytophthora sojae]